MQDCKKYEQETEREVNFRALTVQNSGIYTCKILISHEGTIYHSTNTIKLVVEEGKKAFQIFEAYFLVHFTMEIFNCCSNLINIYRGNKSGNLYYFRIL